ncbi:MAG: hypothetical protein IT553_06255 [Sphingomonadaceae bacterium]|nr:hypothetical protein [Sphingomonadaceae bacterium]
MNIGVFIPIIALLIPIVAIAARSYRRTIEFREKQLELQAGATAEKAAQYAAHTERLEQRVRVLERIITDRGIVVAEEIEALRDQRDH